jgi:hypothetical protein
VCKRFNICDEEVRKSLIATCRQFFVGIGHNYAPTNAAAAATTTTAAARPKSDTQMLGVSGILRAEHHGIQLLARIEEINVLLGQQQIENIATTVSLIQSKMYDRLEAYKRANVQKCITWCERYNIPYNKGVVSTNTFIHTS